MAEPDVARAGSPDPSEAPLIELGPAARPYLVKVGALYVKVLVSAAPASPSQPRPGDQPVGSEGDVAVRDLQVGSDEAAT